jgi:predicted permease
MLQAAEDSIEFVWRRHGVLGLTRLLFDIARRIPAEYASELRGDLRYGLRMLLASPGFTALALTSLTLGIGVATAAYSELNGFVGRDVPAVRHADELVMMKAPVAFPDYERYAARGDLFAGALAYRAPVPFGVSRGGRTERIWGHLVTASYFSTLGVQAAMGRVLDSEDGRQGRAPVVVVSYRFWQNQLGGDAAAIGKPLTINGQPCTVVGVGPADFEGASPMIYSADLWLPLSVGASVAPELADNVLERRDLAVFLVEGRLRPGVSEARAQAALEAMARQLEDEFHDPDRNLPGRRIVLVAAGKLFPVEKKDRPLLTSFFFVLGGLILLIASSNVANLMMARAVDRRKEIAVRLALGAGRARLVRQLVTESMLIAAVAGVLGFGMAAWLMHLASQVRFPLQWPVSFRLEPDGRVLLFTLGLTAFAGLALGLLPALQATRPDLTLALKESSNFRLRRFRRLSSRNLLMVFQMAASLALLLITGFLILGYSRIAGREVGFDPRNLYVISLDPLRDGYSAARTADFFEKLLDRTRGLPAVASATLVDSAPMSVMGRTLVPISVGSSEGAKELHRARPFAVGSDYFATLGVGIVLGRGFCKEDEVDDATAAIVSEKFVRECWPGLDPLGRRIEMGNEDVPSLWRGDLGRVWRGAHLPGKPRVFQVVGVARDLRDGLTFVAKDAPGVIYRPIHAADYAQPSPQGWTLMARGIPGVDVLTQLRHETSVLDDHLEPFHAHTMVEQIDDLMFLVKVALWTYGCIGICGLILASIGLAGVTAYSVTRRRREIGIRVALGAQRSDVMRLVMQEGAVLMLIGAAIGLAAARSATRLISAVVSTVAVTAGTSMSDPRLLVGAPLLLGILALVACYLPARKSLRIDPAVSLRQE